MESSRLTMPLAKSSRILLPLALSAALATSAFAQEHPNVQPNAVRDQVKNPVPAEPPPPSAPQSAAPAKAKPSGAKAKAPAKAPAKASAQVPADSKGTTKAAAAKPTKPPVEKPAPEKQAVRRDPFDTLLTKATATNAPPENLPPGKAGLISETLRIGGIVHSPNGMIAIVSNSQQRVYFLREGDKLYDGSVEKISLDGISFKEIGKDAFGKPLERVVTKRL
jgi:Tfp pilus assembly protein PilP